ncbi:glyoxalase superfamily protein [Rhizobium sp. 2YAF20]|uniref:glyoxalase superfamily protein n=1 Tax=Rhizobium sp. 2YAF20 TaxID=3233027 RepID=UPI003F9E6322
MTVRHIAEAKALAKSLRNVLAAECTIVGHAQALVLIARQNCARDWNTLSARLGEAAPSPFHLRQRVQGRTRFRRTFASDICGTTLSAISVRDVSSENSGILRRVLGMVADMELKFIKDMQRAGIDAAKAEGIYKGRKRNVYDAEIRQRIAAGATKAAAARDLNISRMTVYRALEGQGAPSDSM